MRYIAHSRLPAVIGSPRSATKSADIVYVPTFVSVIPCRRLAAVVIVFHGIPRNSPPVPTLAIFIRITNAYIQHPALAVQVSVRAFAHINTNACTRCQPRQYNTSIIRTGDVGDVLKNKVKYSNAFSNSLTLVRGVAWSAAQHHHMIHNITCVLSRKKYSVANTGRRAHNPRRIVVVYLIKGPWSLLVRVSFHKCVFKVSARWRWRQDKWLTKDFFCSRSSSRFHSHIEGGICKRLNNNNVWSARKKQIFLDQHSLYIA